MALPLNTVGSLEAYPDLPMTTHRLAVNIETRVVIPRILRGDGAVAHEHQVAARNIARARRACSKSPRPCRRPELRVPLWAVTERRVGAGGDFHQRDFLHIALPLPGFNPSL